MSLDTKTKKENIFIPYLLKAEKILKKDSHFYRKENFHEMKRDNFSNKKLEVIY